MRLRLWVRGVLAATALAATGAAAAPIESYGRLPDLEDMGLSPDGTRLAFARVQGEDRVISVMAVGAREPSLVLGIGKAKLRRLSWIDDNDLLIVSSATSGPPLFVVDETRERRSAFVYDLRTHKLNQLKPPEDVRALDTVNGFPTVRVVNGRTKVFFVAPTFLNHLGVPALWEYDVESAGIHKVDDGAVGHEAYAIDAAGDEVAENFWDGKRWRVRARINGGWRFLPWADEPERSPVMLGLAPDGQSVIFSGIGGEPAWQTLSLKTGQWQPAPYSATTLIEDNRSGLPLGLVRESDHLTYSFFDANLQKTWEKILRAFPGEQVDFVSISADHAKVLVRVFGQKSGAVYMLADMGAGHVDPVGYLYSDIPPEQVVETRAIKYAAADGLQLSAYLTLPKGRAAKGLPLVVLPHDGPRQRDDLEFDWMAQALASRGYAVLQPEYRGSRMGPAIARAGYGQWGRKMQTDLSDGVRFLAGQGTVDPKRVCIAGAGYGGYAALAGVSLEPNVYRCAVDVSGPSDLKRMVQWSASRNWMKINATIAYWDRYMQQEGMHDPTYAEISPIRHVDRIEAPVLIIHGRDDTVVPFEQSQLMADAMKAAGKKVELLPLADEDHWLSSSRTRQEMLTAMVRFIEANNPPDPSTAVASR